MGHLRADACVNENTAPTFAADGGRGKKWSAAGSETHEAAYRLLNTRVSFSSSATTS